MLISRRLLLQQIGAAGTAFAVVPSLTDASPTASLSPSSVAEGGGGPIRLNRNENAYGPSPSAIAAIRDAAEHTANRYPDAEIEALQSRLAELHRVRPEQIVLGCGSSEILRIAVSTLAGVRRRVVIASPTFELIDRCAHEAAADVAAVPLTKNYAHDLDGMLAHVDGATTLVYICNPNNPTGSLTPRKDLEAFLARLPGTTRVLIDEAYHHYVGASSDYASFIDRPLGDPRLIVTRSFSAIYGLAGMRVGYAVAGEDAARTLAAHRLPENLTTVAARAAVAALNDTEHVRMSARSNADRRQEFFNQANARMLRVIDSQTNFVMLNTQHQATDVVAHFRSQGVLIAGPFASFDEHVRVSLGTPDDMREFWRVWDLKYGHAM
jgi:histidinol-phosphate aminotransferase